MTSRNIIKVELVVLMVLSLGAMMAAAEPTPGSAPSVDVKLQELAAENARLKSELNDLKVELAKLKEENARLMVLAGVTAPQTREEAEAVLMTTQTDPQTGITTVTGKFQRLTVTRGSRSGHWLRMECQTSPQPKPGEKTPARQATPPGAKMVVMTKFSDRLYEGMKSVTLVIDGKEVSCPVSRYQATPRGQTGARSGMQLYDEQVEVSLDQAMLDQAGSAKDAELRMRQVRIPLGLDQLAQFRAIAARLAGGQAELDKSSQP
jgi:hypothetical protein